MKITIEETEPTLFPEHPKRKFSVEVNNDDLSGDEFARLLSQACIGFGWHPENVAKIIKTDEE